MLTDAQIQAMFRYCKNINKQIAICSQLTGKSEAEICSIVGIDPVKKVRKHPYGIRREWTEKDVENLCTAYKYKVKAPKIADMLDRSPVAVRSKIKELKSKGIIKDE